MDFQSTGLTIETSSDIYERAFEFLNQNGVEHYEITQFKEEFFDKKKLKTWELISSESPTDRSDKSFPCSPVKKEFNLVQSPLSSGLMKKRRKFFEQAESPKCLLKMIIHNKDKSTESLSGSLAKTKDSKEAQNENIPMIGLGDQEVGADFK